MESDENGDTIAMYTNEPDQYGQEPLEVVHATLLTWRTTSRATGGQTAFPICLYECHFPG